MSISKAVMNSDYEIIFKTTKCSFLQWLYIQLRNVRFFCDNIQNSGYEIIFKTTKCSFLQWLYIQLRSVRFYCDNIQNYVMFVSTVIYINARNVDIKMGH